jgi:selenocysteine lyase/cysteine desulfurase
MSLALDHPVERKDMSRVNGRFFLCHVQLFGIYRWIQLDFCMAKGFNWGPGGGHMKSDISRRHWLGRFIGGAAAATTLTQVKQSYAAAMQAVAPLPNWRNDDGYWEKVRKQFMLEPGFAYLNTGTLGPTPRPVYDALTEYWRLMAVNPNENSNIFQDRQDQIRFKAAAFLGAGVDEVAITRNTTEGNTTLCQGLDLKAGDEILLSAFEHGSTRSTYARQAKRFGLVIKEVKFPLPPTNAQVLTAFEAAITPRTRVMHFSNPLGGSGTFLPVKELAQLAHSKNILCFVDGAHCIGMVQFSVASWDIDGFACNAHKWLCGPAGAGLLYVKQSVQDRIWPVIAISNQAKGARKYDQLSRRPWPCVAALEDTLDFQLAIGRARLEQRTRALGSYLRNKVAEIPKVRVYTPSDPMMSCGSTSLGIEGVSGQRLREYLRQKYDAYIPGGGSSVRVSTHYFNTFEQVDRVLKAVRELAAGMA